MSKSPKKPAPKRSLNQASRKAARAKRVVSPRAVSGTMKGRDLRQLVIEVTQRRRGYIDQKKQKMADSGKKGAGREDFIFRGGATLIIDLKENNLRYVITKRINDDRRLQEQRELLTSPDGFGFTYRPDDGHGTEREPFAMLHRGQ